MPWTLIMDTVFIDNTLNRLRTLTINQPTIEFEQMYRYDEEIM